MTTTTIKTGNGPETTRLAGVPAPAAWGERGHSLNLTGLARHLGRDAFGPFEQPGCYIFYDIETTGLSAQHDQILQFAAIRTDGEFNIVDELTDVLNIRCDLAPGVVPSPTALLTTRVWPEQLSGQGFTQPAMIDRIVAVMEDWRLPRLPVDAGTDRVDGGPSGDEPTAVFSGPSVFIGYNSLRFDEEFLRHSLFAALHDPYLTVHAGSCRADVMLMAQAAHLLHPGAILVPEIIDVKSGTAKLSFKLGDLARANGIGFGEHEAHDALADVRATIALCQLIRDRAPSVFALMMQNALKLNVLASITANWAGVPGVDPDAVRILGSGVHEAGDANADLMTRHIMQPYALCGVYGGRSSIKAVMPIGVLPGNGSAMLALDLSIDPASYMALNDDDLRLMCGQKASSPLVTIKANRQPILLPLELSQPDLPPAFEAFIAVIAPDGGDAATAQAILHNRLERIRQAEIITPGIVARLIAITGELEPDYPTSSLVEEQLYAGGFPSRMDTTLRDRMRGMVPAEFVRNIPLLRDHRLREFATRRAFMMFPEALPEQENERLKTLFANRIAGPTGHPWRTTIDAGAEIAKLREQHAEAQAGTLEHLNAIEAFIDRLFARAAISAVGLPDPDDLNGLG